MKQTLLVFPNTNWLYNYISYFNKFCLYKKILQNNDEEIAFLIISDYKADNPYNTLSFTKEEKKITQFLTQIKPNIVKETKVAYEKALNMSNMFMWTSEVKRIIFFYHDNPNTPNNPYNIEKLYYLEEANKLKRRNIEIIPVFINNIKDNYMLGEKIKSNNLYIINDLNGLEITMDSIISNRDNDNIPTLQKYNSILIPEGISVKEYMPLIFKPKRAWIDDKKYSNKILKKDSVFKYETY